MTQDQTPTPKSGTDLSSPKGDQAIQEAIEILKKSETGALLAAVMEQQGITVKAIRAPQDSSYIPDSKEIYIGIPPRHPPSRERLVLMLAGALREAELELLGYNYIEALKNSVEEGATVAYAKKTDVIVTLCDVAYELTQINDFSESFLDELRKMGHDNTVDVYLAERESGGV